MYKVIIVDDEKQIVDGLTKMIKWNEFGFQVCACARNGKEAIDLIKAHRPDLVLVDIRMPEMDGLTMLEHVYSNISKDIEFIILSGYGEFEYAQKALRYNVRNYILKPIDEAVIYKTLLEIKDLLDEKEIRKSEKIKAYINKIIKGDKPSSTELTLHNEEQYGLRFIVLARHYDHSALFGNTASFMVSDLTETNMVKVDLTTAVSEVIGETNMRFVTKQDDDTCLMVAGRSILSSYGYSADRLASCLQEQLRTTKSVCADILLGSKVNSFDNLYESVRSVNKCKNKLFYMNGPSAIIYDDIKNEEFCNIYDDNGAVIRIISAFRKNDMNKVTGSIEQLTEHFKMTQAAPEIVLLHFDSIMSSVMHILGERISNISRVVELYSACKRYQRTANINVLSRMTAGFCMYCSEFSTDRNRMENDILDNVINYVDQNFMEPIRISDIAERFYINPAYLGQLFIKRKGCSLKYYLNKLRIEKSKELLKNTNLKIYEIALRVGYEDPNYFSAKFVEFAEQTPSEYRNLL